MALKLENSSQGKVWWIIASFNFDGTTSVGNEGLMILQSSVLKHCFMTVVGIGPKPHDFYVCRVISPESSFCEISSKDKRELLHETSLNTT